MEILTIISLFPKAYLMIEYWRELGLLILPLATWITSRKMSAIKLKTEGANSISALQTIYDKYIEHNSAILKEVSSRLSEVENHNRSLQKNFNDMQISYAVVVGESKKFEEKYNLIVKEYEQLKIDHDKLKKAFEKYKNENKE